MTEFECGKISAMVECGLDVSSHHSNDLIIAFKNLLKESDLPYSRESGRPRILNVPIKRQVCRLIASRGEITTPAVIKLLKGVRTKVLINKS